ncbi:MAG: phosphate signaling complex protein PhoU [Bdellovibrionales bacterium]|nr:phosphate signaling complex protein PhoU [Bdellovibrionales bacterium]
MNRHFLDSVEELKKELLTMAAMVEGLITRSVDALAARRDREAKVVIEEDDIIDRLEIKIEEECLKILALYQPVAEHLRFVTTVMKINNDLERIGDLAVNIARRAKRLAKHPPIEIPERLQTMADSTVKMLRNSLNAFMERDTILAKKVCLADDEIDRYHAELIPMISESMRRDPEKIDLFIHLLWSSRNLERIADHVTNIAEDVVYMVDGDIIRHTDWEFAEEKVGKKSTELPEPPPLVPISH